MLTDLLRVNKLTYLIILILLQVTLSYFVQSTFFLNETVFFNSYTDIMTYDRIHELFETAKQYAWVSLAILPLMILIKIVFNSFILTTGTLLSSEEFSFSKNYNVCLKAEFVFIAMLLVKILLFSFFIKVNNLSDVSYLPGALSNLFKLGALPKWCAYPLQTINIWEILFCYVATKLFAIQYQVSMKKAFALFCTTYLLNIFILIIISIFFAISFS